MSRRKPLATLYRGSRASNRRRSVGGAPLATATHIWHAADYSGSGTSWPARAGGSNATLVNGPVYTTGSHFQIDKPASDVRHVNFGSPTNVTAWTWLAVLYESSASVANQRPILARRAGGGSGNPGFLCWRASGTSDLRFRLHLSDATQQEITAPSSSGPGSGKFYGVAISVAAGGNMRVWVAGVSTEVAYSLASVPAPNEPVMCGRLTTTGTDVVQAYNVRAVSRWTRVLTATELTQAAKALGAGTA